jgi:uncharacterized protein YaaQ
MMNLVFAIVQNEDGQRVTNGLNKKGFSVTKLCSTGGFLKSGNTTLMAGVKKEKVEEVIEIIKKNSKSRKQLLNYPMSMNGMEGMFTAYPGDMVAYGDSMGTPGTEEVDSPYSVEVVVGGAIVFVLDVARYEKL